MPDMSLSQPNVQAFVLATSDTDAQGRLAHLVDEQILPVIEGVLRRKIGSGAGSAATRQQAREEADDLRSDILAQVLGVLHKARAERVSSLITDLAAFTARVSYNAVGMHLRRKYPQRCSLQNKLRWLLEHRQGLALWQGAAGEWLGGLATWKAQAKPIQSARFQKVLDDPIRWMNNALAEESAKQMNPALLLGSLLTWVGHPVALDDLTAIMGILWEVRETRIESQAEEDPPPDPRKPLSGPTVDPLGKDVVERLDLRRYWMEMGQLPPKQCAALLLQAHDPQGNSLLELLEMEGVASLREMAQAMALPTEILAALWNDLPLGDVRVAAQLGVTTQHVARLRMIARRRLIERLEVAA